MGRARNGPRANAALRLRWSQQDAARRARDEDAHQLAQAVYAEAIQWKREGSSMNLAPVAVSSGMAAPGVAAKMGLEGEQQVAEVAAFLTAAFMRLIVDSTREEFDAWLLAVRESGFIAELEAR